MFAPGPGLPRSRIGRAGAEAPATSGIESWIAAGAPAADRPALLAKGQQRSRLGRCPGWERRWERVLLRSALPCFKPLPHAPLDLRRLTSMQATAFGRHSWGSRGRRFKSGRPDRFFEHLYPELETKTAMIVSQLTSRDEQESKAAAAARANNRPVWAQVTRHRRDQHPVRRPGRGGGKRRRRQPAGRRPLGTDDGQPPVRRPLGRRPAHQGRHPARPHPRTSRAGLRHRDRLGHPSDPDRGTGPDPAQAAVTFESAIVAPPISRQ
jgi:hypothetical protein